MGCRSIREGVWHTFIAGLRVVERTKRKSVWRPCQAVCLYICLWSNISCSKSCWIFMKSGVVESAVSFFGFFFVKSDVVEWGVNFFGFLWNPMFVESGVSFFGFLWNPVLSNQASVSLVFCEIRCCRMGRQFLWFFVKSGVVEWGVSFLNFGAVTYFNWGRKWLCVRSFRVS